MKKLFFLLSIISTSYSFGQCATFNYKETISGSDFVNFNWNPSLSICENDKTIEFGSERFYYMRNTKNSYGDYIYYIQEARGYGWPEIGYVKIASNLELVELSFMNSIVRYGLISPKAMAQKEKNEQIEREKEESRKTSSDKSQYEQIKLLIKYNKIVEARSMMLSLNYPDKFDDYSMVQKKHEETEKEADKVTSEKINSLINQNLFENAAEEYDNLKNKNTEIENNIQNLLDDKYKDSVINLSSKQIEAYIQDYIDSKKIAEDETKRKNERTGQNWQLAMSSLGVLESGEYNVIFDKLGSPSIKGFPQLTNQSVKNIGEFTIYFKSAATFKIEKKDSVVDGSLYQKFLLNSWGDIDNKKVFIDTNENFYFKTKKGLPLADFYEKDYEHGVPRNMVRIIKFYTNNKYINGILIHSYQYRTEKDVKIKKKDY